jgi:hypothetical protein
MERTEQNKLINKFVEHLTEINGVFFTITKRPDEENSTTKDIDAIAECNGIRIAIEHTSIDTVPKQREDSVRFLKVFSIIEDQLRGTVTDRICIAVPFYAIPNKVSWSKLQKTLKDWLEKTILNIPYGSDEYDILGLPFKIRINKHASEKPSFRIVRDTPNDSTLSERVGNSINRKLQKLVPYKKQEYKTCLLIENDDIALMSLDLMVSSIKVIIDREIGLISEVVDEIWYADTSIPNDVEFFLIWSKKSNSSHNS